MGGTCDGTPVRYALLFSFLLQEGKKKRPLPSIERPFDAPVPFSVLALLSPGFSLAHIGHLQLVLLPADDIYGLLVAAYVPFRSLFLVVVSFDGSPQLGANHREPNNARSFGDGFK